MESKMLVELPTVPKVPPVQKKVPPITFPSQGKKPPADIVAQLEQNMKFLQEQHQATLVALHLEVDSLRQRNRDLQFQLVFSKGSAFVPSSPSSPEDNGTGFVKAKGSPVCVNVAPLQVELLEKDLQDIKISLQEAKTQNQYLSDIVEQQKKKLDTSKEQKPNKQLVTDVGVQVDCPRLNPVEADLGVLEAMVKQLLKQNADQKKEIETLEAASANTTNPAQTDLATRLEGSEATVKLLLKLNEDQRKEIATLKAASANANKGARSRDSNNSHHNRGSPTSSTQEQIPHKFPPLQSQSYWHRRTPRNGRNRHDKQDHQSEVDFTVLPQLQNDNMSLDTVITELPFHPIHAYHNFCRDKIDKINRKYRVQTSQKDRRDTDNNNHHHHHHHHHHNNPHHHNNSHHHRRDYKDRNSKDHHKELVDSAEGSREADNSMGSKS
ncbi:uncharacterized protein LOC116428345 [Nomia melanderi]|uniref:uncharacterized protein LOC116428345 n=1 Tax=Nomia melanderi TaxID=2448451 RepID=UPI00130442B0|nr:protein CLEC16A homolog [Nomia melanderi]XP_031835744.1 protein CLEC16A homolog [Nomia melanderi]